MTDTYVAVDLETTGLNPKKDKIIEIGMAKVIRGEIVDTMEVLVNPGRMLEKVVMNLTGITNENLQKAPYLENELSKVLDFLEDMPLLGHHLIFDYSFLKKAVINNGGQFEKQGIDTLTIARKILPELESRRLGFLCEYFQISHKAHRALEDAVATHYLYRKLSELFDNRPDCYKEEYQNLLEPKPLSYQVKKEVPITKGQKERLYRLIETYHLKPSVDIERMTKNEASRYTDEILTQQRLVGKG